MPIPRALLLIALLLAGGPGHAGGGAETALLVINADSPLSLEIGHAWARMRELPEGRIVYLRGIPALAPLPVVQFRERVWGPISQALASPPLRDDVDTIVYSTGFPYAVDFSADLRGSTLRQARLIGRHGSLTGMTFHAREVERAGIGHLHSRANRYFRVPTGPGWRPEPPQLPLAMQRRLDRAAAQTRRGELAGLPALQALAAEQPEHPVILHTLAAGHADSGQPEAAFDALERAIDAGWTNIAATEAEPAFQRWRGTTRYRGLIARMSTAPGRLQQTHGFSASYQWLGAEVPLRRAEDAVAGRYFLSTLLGYLGPRGNSRDEILAYLRRAAAADATHPRGTVYLMQNRDIRARTREPLFGYTAAALRALGHRAEILDDHLPGQDGITPRDRLDVIGAVLGSRQVDWAGSGSRLLPGAIAEALTSYAGHFDSAKQTKLSAHLRAGAAGSSGAVAEPYALQTKFPVPMLHVHYARGASLAEAWYQSVAAPYQLLVVGEPLTQPFARRTAIDLAPPEFTADAVSVRAAPWARDPDPRARLELRIDGQRVASGSPHEALLWPTAGVDRGPHELRLTLIDGDPVETRSTVLGALALPADSAAPTMQARPARLTLGQTFQLRGEAGDADRVEIRHRGHLLATAEVHGGRWQSPLAASALGPGVARLDLRARTPAGWRRALGATLEVTWPPLRPARAEAGAHRPGLQAALSAAGGSARRVVTALDGALDGLRKDGAPKRLTSAVLTGQFLAPVDGHYELQLQTPDPATVLAAGNRAEVDGDSGTVFLPLALAAGWHDIEVTLRPGNRPWLRAVLTGASVGQELAGAGLRHRAPATD